MAAPKDLTGQRFGRLTVLRLCEEPYISPSGKKTRRWICRCDCGREISVLQNALTGKHQITGQRYDRATLRAADGHITSRAAKARAKWDPTGMEMPL